MEWLQVQDSADEVTVGSNTNTSCKVWIKISEIVAVREHPVNKRLTFFTKDGRKYSSFYTLYDCKWISSNS